MSLGKAIRTVRTAKRMYQSDLADNSGLDVSYISLLERDKRDPTWSTVEKICEGLGVSPVLVIALSESDSPALEPYMPLVHAELWRVTKKGELPQGVSVPLAAWE